MRFPLAEMDSSGHLRQRRRRTTDENDEPDLRSEAEEHSGSTGPGWEPRLGVVTTPLLENDPEPLLCRWDERPQDHREDTQRHPSSSDSASNEPRPPPPRPPPRRLGPLEYLWAELTRGQPSPNAADASSDGNEQQGSRYAEKRRRVYAFMRIPLELEKFLFYGFLQCVDAFCHTFTFLPIRILMAMMGWVLRLRAWTAANTCDVLKVAIIVIASLLMQYIDTSKMYHQVRGQGVIKLYIFYNMLEVADKLFSSFGQDILDALLWTASERPGRRRRRFLSTLLHLAIAVVYASCHAVLVLLQATTLNVAFNSHNQSLLTIMMSNNFVELKGAVFKKFAKPNLFQMSCSDVRERFHTLVLLLVVVLRNMTAVNWKLEHLNEMIPDLAMVLLAELMVDWLKHAFITKFNEISSEVYKDFSITLAFDVVRSHERRDSFTDFSDQVSRRMGFIPIPISIMLLRVVSQSVDFQLNPHNGYLYALLGVWVGMLAVKMVNGVFLHARAVEQVERYERLQAEAEFELYRRRLVEKKSKSVPNSPHLSLIDFTDVLAQAIKTPPRVTASDLLAQWEELSLLRHRTDSNGAGSGAEVLQPRRSTSIAESTPRRRDASLPSAQPSNLCCATEIDDKGIGMGAEGGELGGAHHHHHQPSPSHRRLPSNAVAAGGTTTPASLDEVEAFTRIEAEPMQEIIHS